MGAITHFAKRKSFRNVEWNPDRLRATDRQILCALVETARTIADIIAITGYETEYVTHRVHRMCGDVPPLINQRGISGFFQLSAEGRKVMRVSTDPVVSAPQQYLTVAPGPRGQLVKILKEKPTSAAEIMRRTGFNYQQVYYTLKTLQERGLMGERCHDPNDGRALLYRLKSTPDLEPAKPVLTPSLVPLCDDADWHTWMERLLLQKLGGPDIVLEGVSDEKFITPSQPKTSLPKILIIGANYNTQPIIEKEFGRKFNLNFFDDKYGSSGLIQRCRQVAHVFLCTARCRHSHMYAIRDSGVPMTLVSGNHSSLRLALEKFHP